MIKRGIKDQTLIGTKVTYDQVKDLEMRDCVDCIRGASKSLTTYYNPNKDWEKYLDTHPAIYVYTDCKGPYPVASYRGEKYVSDYTTRPARYTGIIAMKSLSEVGACLDKFIQDLKHMRLEDSMIAKKIYSDFAGVYISHKKEFQSVIVKHNAEHIPSPPHKHELNGVIERDGGTISDKARIFMYAYDVPLMFFVDALEYAAFFRNRTPHPKLGYKTPFQIVSGKVADVSMMVPFYAPGNYHVSKEERKSRAYDKRAIECRFLGIIGSAYKLWIPRWHLIAIRRDVVFELARDQSLSAEEEKEQLLRNYRDLKLADDEYLKVSEVPDFFDVSTHNMLQTKLSQDIESNEIYNDDSNNQNHQNVQGMKDDDDYYDVNQNGISYDQEMNLPEIFDDFNQSYFVRAFHVDGTEGDYELKKIDLAGKLYRALSNEICYKPCKREYIMIVSLVTADAVMSNGMRLGNVPKNLKEIIEMDPDEAMKWLEAYYKEMNQLEQKNVWEKNLSNKELADIRSGKIKPIDMKLSFSNKYDNQGNLVYKCRLVARGFKQRLGIDYDEVYAPKLQKYIMRILLLVSNILGWHSILSDVRGAFPEAYLDRVIYAKLKVDDVPSNEINVKLKRALYGLKQAAFEWNSLLNAIMISIGMSRLKSDPCVYVKHDDTSSEKKLELIVSVHVDDLLSIAKTKEINEKFARDFSSKVTEVTSIENYSKYLGVEITKDEKEECIYIHQEKYIKSLLQKFKPQRKNKNKKIHIPMTYQKNLNVNNVDKSIKVKVLQEIVGTLRFLADNTRPDILATLGILSQYVIKPYPELVGQINHLLKYLEDKCDFRIKLGGKDKNIEMFGFCDASFSQIKDSKGRISIVIFLAKDSGAVITISKKEITVSHSAMESEISAIDAAIRYIVFIREVLEEIEFKQLKPTKLYVDTKSGRDLCYSLKSNDRTRHINSRINYIREQINKGIVELIFINTELNVSDILTKGVFDIKTFHIHRYKIFNGFNNQDFMVIENSRKYRVHNSLNLANTIIVDDYDQ